MVESKKELITSRLLFVVWEDRLTFVGSYTELIRAWSSEPGKSGGNGKEYWLAKICRNFSWSDTK
jgi:hypothetical protein